MPLQRDREAGSDTGPGATMQDAAHVIAAIYGAQGLGGIDWGGLGGGSSGGSSASTGFGGMDWSDPKTYLRMGNSLPGQRQQQPQSNLSATLAKMQLEQEQNALQMEMERLERERLEQERQRRLAMAGWLESIRA